MQLIISKVVVFDFDKTLTTKDTNLGFYKFAGRQQPLFVFKLLIYFGLLLFRKLRLVSNTRLKNLGLYLFLKNKNENDIVLLSENYSKFIELNMLVKDQLIIHKNESDRVVIATASLSSYVRPIFPEIEVVGSELDFTCNRIKLKTHCYSQKKVDCLNLIGIKKIDILYTDSLSDMPVAKISNIINLVKRGEIIQCNSFKDFVKAVGE